MKTPVLRTAFIFCATLLMTRGIAPALDLTPASSYKELEGMKIPVVQFSDGEKKIQYKPPFDWQPEGGGNSVKFLPPGMTGASLTLMVVAKAPPDPATEATATPENLQEWVMQYIPKGAKEVGFIKEVPSPFQVEGLTSDEFIFSYVLNAVRETISISVVDRHDTERLVVIIVARTKDFDAIHAQGISSMFSWRAKKN